MLTWHQLNAIRVNYRLRHVKAHIHADDYIQTGRALCGVVDPQVYVDPKYRHNPRNNVCPACVRLADSKQLLVIG